MNELPPIRVVVEVKMKLWDAVKLRIAGKHMQHLIKDVERQLRNLADAGIAAKMDEMRSRE